MLTVAVIVVPLIIAVVVTLWSLDQVRYRPRKRRPAAHVARETSGSGAHEDIEAQERRDQRESVGVAGGTSGPSSNDGRSAGIGR